MWGVVFRVLRAKRDARTVNRVLQVCRNSLSNGGTPKEPKDVEPIREMLRKIALNIESKMYEMNEMFSKATKEMNDVVARSTKYLSEELDRAEKSFDEMTRKLKVRGKTANACVAKYRVDVERVREAFAARIKACNEKTSMAIENLRSKHELELQEVKNLRSNLIVDLKDCLTRKGEVKQCVEEKSDDAVKNYENIMAKLKKSPKRDDDSLMRYLKLIGECHAEARREATRDLKKILEEVKSCINENASDDGTVKPANVSSGSPANGGGSTEAKVRELKTMTLLLAGSTEPEGTSRRGESKCTDYAKTETRVVVDLLISKLMMCTKLGGEVLGVLEDPAAIREVLRYANEIARHASELVVACEDKTPKDAFECIRKKLKSMQKTTLNLKKMKPDSEPRKRQPLTTDHVVACYQRTIENALGQLNEVERRLRECIEEEKKR